MSRVRELHKKWSRDPTYRRACDDLDSEFASTLNDLDPVSAGRVLKPLHLDDDLLGEMLESRLAPLMCVVRLRHAAHSSRAPKAGFGT